MPSVCPFDATQDRPGFQIVAAALGLVMVKRHFATQCQQKCQGVFGHFDQAVIGNIRDHDAPLRGGSHVDVVQSDAQSGHDAALGGGLDHGSGHSGPVGHDGVGLDGQGRQGSRILGRGHHQFGVDFRQRLAFDV